MKLPFSKSDSAKVRTPDDRMTLTEHLAELRRCRLVVIARLMGDEVEERVEIGRAHV